MAVPVMTKTDPASLHRAMPDRPIFALVSSAGTQVVLKWPGTGQAFLHSSQSSVFSTHYFFSDTLFSQ
jgi:hypothetical protein